MKSTLLSIGARLLCLAALAAATSSDANATSAAEEAGWGHCVQYGSGGSNPTNFCVCENGPNSSGQYTCFQGGTSCAERYPAMCGGGPL